MKIDPILVFDLGTLQISAVDDASIWDSEKLAVGTQLGSSVHNKFSYFSNQKEENGKGYFCDLIMGSQSTRLNIELKNQNEFPPSFVDEPPPTFSYPEVK